MPPALAQPAPAAHFSIAKCCAPCGATAGRTRQKCSGRLQRCPERFERPGNCLEQGAACARRTPSKVNKSTAPAHSAQRTALLRARLRAGAAGQPVAGGRLQRVPAAPLQRAPGAGGPPGAWLPGAGAPLLRRLRAVHFVPAPALPAAPAFAAGAARAAVPAGGAAAAQHRQKLRGLLARWRGQAGLQAGLTGLPGLPGVPGRGKQDAAARVAGAWQCRSAARRRVPGARCRSAPPPAAPAAPWPGARGGAPAAGSPPRQSAGSTRLRPAARRHRWSGAAAQCLPAPARAPGPL